MPPPWASAPGLIGLEPDSPCCLTLPIVSGKCSLCVPKAHAERVHGLLTWPGLRDGRGSLDLTWNVLLCLQIADQFPAACPNPGLALNL